MSRKISYYIQRPEKNDQPLQMIIGSAADKKIAEEEKQKNQFKAFNSQYYGAVTEYGLYNGVRQWLRVQDLRKYAAAGIGFRVNHPYDTINHRKTGAILKSASAHLFGNLGIEIPIDIEHPKLKEEWVRDQAGNRFRATIIDDDLEGGAACIQPSLGRRIRFGTNTVPDNVATLVETQGLTSELFF